MTAPGGPTVDRRTYLKALGLATAGVVGTAGCLGNGTGTLATRVTDQPTDIDDFESCVVTIAGIWLGPDEAATDGTADGSGEREYLAFDEPAAADLVDLQGEETQLIDERELSAATYAFLQLDVDGVDATLDGGEDADVRVPGEAPLTFDEAFEIRADTRTSFTADFTPVRQGGTGRYVLQPVPDGIRVTYEE